MAAWDPNIGGVIEGIQDFNADQFDFKFGDPYGSSSLFNPLGIEESYLYENRSATRIFDDHQSIAVTNIGGGQSPGFAINDNLYGFSIFQYKTGLGTGWNVANTESLLGFDLTNALTGGDQVANVSSYFFNLHPRAISVSEPFATQIVPTQGSGIYVESQGVVLRTLSISGTTGYRPSIGKIRTNDPSGVINHETGEPTGFLNFIQLRNVFRNYSDLKKNPRQTHKFYMIWYNGKEQEAWFFEPTTFLLNRDASSPFTYRYEISGTLTQKVFFSSIVSKVDGGFSGLHFYLDSMRKAQSILTGGLLGGLLSETPVGNLADWMNLVNEAHETYDNVVNQMTGYLSDTVALTNTVPLLVVGAVSLAQSFLRTTKKVEDQFKGLAELLETPSDRLSYGEFWAEKVFNFEDFQKKTLRNSLEALKILNSTAVEKGAFNSAYKKKSSSISPTAVSQYGSGNILPDDVSWETEQIPNDFNLDFYAFLASKGVSRDFADAVIDYNGLQYPYISSHPTKKQSMSGVRGPGSFIYMPAEPKPIPQNIYTLLPYSMNKNTNVYEETLGRDIKLNKISSGTGQPTFSFAISPTGDLDVVQGRKNIEQAIEIKLNTTRGELPLHQGFGFVPIIGVKGTRNLNFNLYLSLNDTMLSDGRIEDLSKVKIQIKEDQTNVSFNANIIASIPYVPVTFTTKG